LKIKQVYISNLRNHTLSEINFNKGVNVIRGLNGSGKTTILEAISILSISKTFLPANDSALIKSGEDNYTLNCTAISDVGVDYKIKINYKSGSRKKISSSIGENLNPKDILGIIPIVILSPDHKSLTFGSPQDKRQFIDTVLSQSSKMYVDESLKYKKYLKQRNVLLTTYQKTGNLNKEYFEILTDMFIKSAIEIIHKRILFVNEFCTYFKNSYSVVSNRNETPGLIYKPDSVRADNSFTKAEIEDQLLKLRNKIMSSELKRGSTLFGPHKDDLIFTVNNLNSKDSASQGQHKSLLISIKLAEYEFLKNILNETPVILFDDIFSELDIERSNTVFEKIIYGDAQTIITMTNSERLMEKFHSVATYMNVENGKVIENVK
jgi:DNA replication and repair protein RecF